MFLGAKNFGGNKSNLGGTAPKCPPVVTGMNQSRRYGGFGGLIPPNKIPISPM